MTIPKQSLRQIPLNQLVAHDLNRPLEEDGISELADSIREHGLLQPLVVTEHPTEYDRWLILAGHRRVVAARLAGRTAVPCVVRHNLDGDVDEQLVVMLVENCQRKDLTALQKAESFGVLRKRGLKVAEIARRTGLSASSVSQYLRLLDLDPETRGRVQRGELTVVAAQEAVVAVRQQTRATLGHKPNGRRGIAEPAYLTRKHPLAGLVAERCDHPARPSIGGVGCGQCWEAEIRDAALYGMPSAGGEPAYDEAAVLRRLDGDKDVQIRKADRIEIVRRARLQGWSLKDIKQRCGITKPERYLLRSVS